MKNRSVSVKTLQKLYKECRLLIVKICNFMYLCDYLNFLTFDICFFVLFLVSL